MEAMESVGIGTLYRCAYELYSPFVHNASLDWDVQASGESGVLLKPIFTSDTIQYDGPRMVVCWVVSQSTFGLINEYLDVWSHIRSNKAEEVTTKLRSLKAIAFPLHSRVCEVFDANFNNL